MKKQIGMCKALWSLALCLVLAALLAPAAYAAEAGDAGQRTGSPVQVGNKLYFVENGKRTYGWQEWAGGLCYADPKTGELAVGLVPVLREDGSLEDLYLFDEMGQLTVNCIDVSRYNNDACENNTIDWQAVKESGIEYVVVRLGYRGWGNGWNATGEYDSARDGALVVDAYAEQNLKGAQEAGLQVGAYFFTQAVTVQEAQAEAQFAVEYLQSIDVCPELPIYCDTERSSAQGEAGRADYLTMRQRTACVQAFCEAVEQAGYRAGVYFSSKWVSRGKLDLESLRRYSLWEANYSVAETGTFAQMRQFASDGNAETSKYVIPGITGKVDLNYYYPSPTYQRGTQLPGHSPCYGPAVAPTCTEPGRPEGWYCEDCGAMLDGQAALPPLGHLPLEGEGVAPTCTEPGLTGGSVCERCRQVLEQQRPIPALGHSFTQYTGKSLFGQKRFAICDREGCAEKAALEAVGKNTAKVALLDKGEALRAALLTPEELALNGLVFKWRIVLEAQVCGQEALPGTAQVAFGSMRADSALLCAVAQEQLGRAVEAEQLAEVTPLLSMQLRVFGRLYGAERQIYAAHGGSAVQLQLALPEPASTSPGAEYVYCVLCMGPAQPTVYPATLAEDGEHLQFSATSFGPCQVLRIRVSAPPVQTERVRSPKV